MKIGTKVAIATAFCAMGFVATVVLVFVNPPWSGYALGVGLLAGAMVRRWKARAAREKDPKSQI